MRCTKQEAPCSQRNLRTFAMAEPRCLSPPATSATDLRHCRAALSRMPAVKRFLTDELRQRPLSHRRTCVGYAPSSSCSLVQQALERCTLRLQRAVESSACSRMTQRDGGRAGFELIIRRRPFRALPCRRDWTAPCRTSTWRCAVPFPLPAGGAPPHRHRRPFSPQWAARGAPCPDSAACGDSVAEFTN